MRQIEKEMLNALNEKRNWKSGNTSVEFCKVTESVGVRLLGHLIFLVDGIGKRHFTLAGWNTSTTRSRLRALGVNVSQRDRSAYYNGKHINVSEWYEI